MSDNQLFKWRFRFLPDKENRLFHAMANQVGRETDVKLDWVKLKIDGDAYDDD